MYSLRKQSRKGDAVCVKTNWEFTLQTTVDLPPVAECRQRLRPPNRWAGPLFSKQTDCKTSEICTVNVHGEKKIYLISGLIVVIRNNLKYIHGFCGIASIIMLFLGVHASSRSRFLFMQHTFIFLYSSSSSLIFCRRILTSFSYSFLTSCSFSLQSCSMVFQ